MLAITCDKCRRRYTATDDELRVYLQQAEGKKYAQVLCPHCGKPSKIAENRIHQALRFSPPVEQPPAAASTADQGEPSSSGKSAHADSPEGENPPA